MSFVTSNEHRQSAAELTVFASFVSCCMMQSFVNCLTLHLMRLLDKIGLQDNSVMSDCYQLPRKTKCTRRKQYLFLSSSIIGLSLHVIV